MDYHEPPFLHSTDEEGRHWLTTAEFAPMQMWPVAANHCRAGHFLARVVRAKLATLEEVPSEITLTRNDIQAVPAFAHRYPERSGDAREVRMRLVRQHGPPRVENGVGLDDGDSSDLFDANAFDGDDDVTAEDVGEPPDLDMLKELAAALGVDPEADSAGGATEFITPQPPNGWQGSYDDWIADTARALGLEVASPRGPEAYHDDLARATAEAQRRLPNIRERFIAGLDGLALGLTIGLTSAAGGTEFVWIRALDWSDPAMIKGQLESDPQDCPGYEAGQHLDVAVAGVIDYVLGSETAGVVDPGLTERIAEDYGLVVR